MKDFNVLIDEKPFFEIPVKNKEEPYEQIIEMCKIITIQQAIYWIMNTSKIFTN